MPADGRSTDEGTEVSRDIYTDLAWLARPPADFAARCRALDGEEQREAGAGVQALANHALDENQLSRLAGAIARVRASGATLTPLVPFRLGIVGNATTH